MNLKNLLALAALVAAANTASAQDVPAPRHVSEQILATNKPDRNGNHTGWPLLMERDIAWKRRVWRDIDVKAKGNELFRQEKGDKSLLNTLVAGVMNGKITAYRDDMFRQELSADELAMRVKILSDRGSEGGKTLVSKYQAKEDSLGLLSGSAEVRIVGLAAMVEQNRVDGDSLVTIDLPMFWVYYIDALNYLAESPSVRPGFTWADILESRCFYGNTSRENLTMTKAPVTDPPENKQ